MTARTSRLVGLACYIVLIVLITLGLKSFTLNRQALDMWQATGSDLIDPLLNGHPHGMRYLIYYPIFEMADLLSVSSNLVFSFFCATILYFCALLTSRFRLACLGSAASDLRLSAFIVFLFLLSLFMNGRLILVFSGVLLILFAGSDWFERRTWTIRNSVEVFAGCLLASLSSGTIMIGLAVAGGIILVALLRSPTLLRQNIPAPVSVFVVILVFSSYAVIGIHKNITYFSTGEPTGSYAAKVDSVAVSHAIEVFGGLLGHGALLVNLFIAGVFLVAMLFGWSPMLAIRQASLTTNLFQFAMLTSWLGGFFAYSVLVTMIVPACLVLIGLPLPWLGMAALPGIGKSDREH